jgi:hypothetical protein
MSRLLTAVVFSFSLASLAQTSDSTPTQAATASAAKDPQAFAIVQKALQVLGAGPNTPVSSIVATGTYTTFMADGSSSSVSLSLEVLGTQKFRRAVDLSDGTHVAIVNGATGWSVSPKDTQGLSLSQLAGNKFEDLPVLALSEWLSSPSVQLQVIGTEVLGGTTLTHVSVAPKGLSSTDAHLESVYEEASRCEIYFDSATSLPVRIRYYDHPNDWREAFPVDLYLSDFRNVGGILMPFQSTRYVGNTQISATTWQTFALNAPVNDSDFYAEVAQ